jgi:O-antigen/teichoic acid export membrane protein
MATVRVRRSGFVAFTVRILSAITGLIFVVLVTNNISQANFGLWSLVLRVITYVAFAGNILSFWTLRYRARGTNVGRTSFIGALILSAILSGVYIPISIVIASTATTDFGYSLFFFLLAAPQIVLSLTTGAIESVLLGYFPEKASLGFMIYEFAKVIIGVIAVPILHLSLEGAILAVIFAQICQIISLGFLAKGEFVDKISFGMLGKMFRTGWLAILTGIPPLIISFDFLIVSELTKSLTELADFGASLTVAAVVGYSSWLTTGLYASILSGKDSKASTSQIFNLQVVFVVPMALGAIILSYRMLHAFNPIYATAWPILVVLAIATAFSSITNTPETVISGTDMTDLSNKTDFSMYRKSKLFLLSKINITLACVHLIILSIVGLLFGTTLLAETVNFLGYPMSGLVAFGVIWATIYLLVSAIGLGIKTQLSLRILPVRLLERSASLKIAFSGLGFVISSYTLSRIIPLIGGTIQQAIEIGIIGLISLAVYGSILFALDSNIRNLTKTATGMFISSLKEI